MGEMDVFDLAKESAGIEEGMDGRRKLVVYPRVHCFSLDLSEKYGFMKHGSFGFSIDSLPITIEVNKSTHDDLRCDIDIKSIDKRIDFDDLRDKLGVNDNWSVEVRGGSQLVRNHVGIGISTQLGGGIMLACAKVSGMNLGADDLFEMGIGSTSTLGLKLLMRPGMVVETGLVKKGRLSTTVYNISSFPFFTIVAIPKHSISVSGQMEDDFYDRILPDADDVPDRIAYEVFERMLPAICEKNFDLFMDAVSVACRLGTKPAEEAIQSRETIGELNRLRSLFGFAAISSLGPTIYSFSLEDPTRTLAGLICEEFRYVVLSPRIGDA